MIFQQSLQCFLCFLLCLPLNNLNKLLIMVMSWNGCGGQLKKVFHFYLTKRSYNDFEGIIEWANVICSKKWIDFQFRSWIYQFIQNCTDIFNCSANCMYKLLRRCTNWLWFWFTIKKIKFGPFSVGLGIH